MQPPYFLESEVYVQYIDFEILNFISSNFKSDFMDYLMVSISNLGNHGVLFIVIGILLSIIKKYRKLGLSILTSLLIGYVVGNLMMKPFFARVRPYDVANVAIIIDKLKDFSFPSGHTLVAFEFATALSLYFKKISYFAFVLAMLMGFSRLYLYVHYPSDVLAGAILGSLFGYIGVNVVLFYYNHIIKKLC